MTCPCCHGPWEGPPKLMGKTLVTPQGFAELTPAQSAVVALLLPGPKAYNDVKYRKHTMVGANSILRVINWTISYPPPGEDGMVRLERL